MVAWAKRAAPIFSISVSTRDIERSPIAAAVVGNGDNLARPNLSLSRLGRGAFLDLRFRDIDTRRQRDTARGEYGGGAEPEGPSSIGDKWHRDLLKSQTASPRSGWIQILQKSPPCA
jgi:hypothetical protein